MDQTTEPVSNNDVTDEYDQSFPELEKSNEFVEEDMEIDESYSETHDETDESSSETHGEDNEEADESNEQVDEKKHEPAEEEEEEEEDDDEERHESSQEDNEGPWDEHVESYPAFHQTYRCLPVSHINKSHLEAGNRIIMPPSALDSLVWLRIGYPWLFQIQNSASGHVSHCGVLEFSGEEGLVYLPNWMMKNLKLAEGELVNLKNSSLQKGTYMKLQPHSMKFTTLTNPKAVLERTFRDFTCVSVGDTIMINHNNADYYLDVVEAKPWNAISVIDTDCEVDFAPALDYKEPEEKPKTVFGWKKENDSEQGKGKFEPFSGASRRLDGMSSKTVIAAPVEDNGSVVVAGAERSMSVPKVQNKPGRLVFGSEDSNRCARKVSSKIEEKKFQAFTGKKYTLGG